jgi:5-methyltetrahydropteroyltriglutamate--homocysteine methyltransferase
MAPRTAVLGLARIGPNRELKFALEDYWAGRSEANALLATAQGLRADGWQRALHAGIDVVPCGDFSLYDHVLDTAWGVGAIPERFGGPDGIDGLDGLFALARGSDREPPLEAIKWFDTNYHHLVPELVDGQAFSLRAGHWLGQLREASQLGIAARPVVLGPLSFLLLSSGVERPLELLDALVPVYEELLRELALAGAREIQIDEPCLVLERSRRDLDAFSAAWRALDKAAELELSLATYFAGLHHDATLERVLALEPAELHLDLVRAPDQLAPALLLASERRTRISLGLLDARNVWRADLGAALTQIDSAVAALGDDRITVAPSCPFLHIPYEAARETQLDAQVRGRLAFAAERLSELAVLQQAAALDDTGRQALLASRDAPDPLARLERDATLRERATALSPADYRRRSPAWVRRTLQTARVALPPLPTTTVGSFPQTEELRGARRRVREGVLTSQDYEQLIEAQIERVIAAQMEIGLDVLVHGEPERDDMIEYFAAQLDGFAICRHGWVQSFGSGCVKPPILHGDVVRRSPMSLRWWRYAQSLTAKPVKGILTGPVTMMQWSFVRDDQTLEQTCTQLALAICDEVADLEGAGAFAIQVDEPALREGLPLRREDREAYLLWAIDCFRLAVGRVRDDTQVHTHMCYSRLDDIVEHIGRMDADVISIETSRTGMRAVDAFCDERTTPGAVGPGVYDTHSGRVPSADSITRLLASAEQRIGRERLWVNPDCGLKSRSWEEALTALQNMVSAAHRRRLTPPPAR